MLIRAIRYTTRRLLAAALVLYLFNTYARPALGLQTPLAAQGARILDSFDSIMKALGDPPDDGTR